jgi:hypothetical protein
MESLAAWLGTLLGAALKECAPTLRDILRDAIRAAITDTMENSKADRELIERLKTKLLELKAKRHE